MDVFALYVKTRKHNTQIMSDLDAYIQEIAVTYGYADVLYSRTGAERIEW